MVISKSLGLGITSSLGTRQGNKLFTRTSRTSGPLFSEPAVENQLNSGLGIALAVSPTGGDRRWLKRSEQGRKAAGTRSRHLSANQEVFL